MGLAFEAATRAKAASKTLARLSLSARNEGLFALAQALEVKAPLILAANAQDIAVAKEKGTPEPLLDRLLLTEDRIQAMANAVREIALQPDVLGNVVSGHVTANGLRIEKVSVPLGVVAVIYEARPNVTADACALSLKSGNACVLRGGSMAARTNEAIITALRGALESCGINPDAFVSLAEADRSVTQELMGLTGLIDVLIPRGGASLIQSCVENAKVPIIETGTGNCHIYVHSEANLEMARRILINAKTQRPGVCNAAESLVLDREIAKTHLNEFVTDMLDRDVVIYLDPAGFEYLKSDMTARVHCADEELFAREFLDLALSIAIVEGIDEAITHINAHSTGHSEAIVTDSYEAAERFLREVDSTSVYVNASTRFTDGGMFGLGAEIGISTQKLHARGPMGASALTSTKYLIRGCGQVRE